MNKVTKRIGGIVFSAAMALSLVVVAAPATASAATTCSVYFENTDSWDSVYVYYTTDTDAWSDAAFADDALTDSDGDGWYEFEVSTDTDVYLIFASANDWSGSQTTDIWLDAGSTEAWVSYASYGTDVEKGTAASYTAPDGWSSDDADTTSDEDTTSDTTSDEDTTSDTTTDTTTETTTQAGDATPIVAVLVALMGCVIIAVAGKKKAT